MGILDNRQIFEILTREIENYIDAALPAANGAIKADAVDIVKNSAHQIISTTLMTVVHQARINFSREEISQLSDSLIQHADHYCDQKLPGVCTNVKHS